MRETLFKAEDGNRGLLGGIKGGDKMAPGKKEFDFRINLPSEVEVNKSQWHDLKINKSIRLPPTLSSKAWSWAFYYEIVVDLKRSGLLTIDDTLRQAIGYTPVLKEPKPSPLRLQAYKDGSPIPGPTTDPDGWKTFPPVDIKGELFKTRKVAATYSLSIAAPLIYASGTSVPFFLTVESSDGQALGLLSDHHAPDVGIRRKIKTVPGVGDAGGSIVMPGSEEERPISNVVWTNPPGGQVEGGGPNKRVLYGEMKLPTGSMLRPSFEFGDFHMKYCIDMFAPLITGFVPENKQRLFRTDVEICTVAAQYDRHANGQAGGSHAPVDMKA